MKKGFTLLELLMAMSLIGILSFSIIYSFQNRQDEALKKAEAILTRLINIGKKSEILNDEPSYLMILKKDPRIIRLKMKDQSIYETLPDGARLIMVNCKEINIEQEEWECDQLVGKKFLTLLIDGTQLALDEV